MIFLNILDTIPLHQVSELTVVFTSLSAAGALQCQAGSARAVVVVLSTGLDMARVLCTFLRARH